jgi:hypothetical protein
VFTRPVTGPYAEPDETSSYYPILFFRDPLLLKSWDSLAGIPTGLGLDGLGSIPGSVQTGSGCTQPPVQRVSGALCLGVKRPRSEIAHSSPFSAEVKNGGAIPPLHHTCSWRDV